MDKIKMALSIQHGEKTLDTGRCNDLNGIVHPEEKDPVPSGSGIKSRSLNTDKPIPGTSGLRRKSDEPKLLPAAHGKRPRVEDISIPDEFEGEEVEKENVSPESESKPASNPLALPPAIISSQAQLSQIQPQVSPAASSEFSSLVALIQNQQIIAAQKEKLSSELVSKLLDIHGSKK